MEAGRNRSANESSHLYPVPDTGGADKGKGKRSNPKKKPVKWVDSFTCFQCGKEGPSPPLRRCSQWAKGQKSPGLLMGDLISRADGKKNISIANGVIHIH